MLLVVMATNDAVATNDDEEPSSAQLQNDTDVGNTNTTDIDDLSDVSERFNDVDQKVQGSEDSNITCSINSEQFDSLSNSLMELVLQLELLQTTVDRIELDVAPTTISG